MRLVVGTALAMLAGPAFAEPVTLACTLFQTTAQGGDMMRVNRIEIDLAAKTIILSAAETIGTSKPIIFDLTEPGQAVVKVPDASTFRAAGFVNGDDPYILTMGWAARGEWSVGLATAFGYPSPTYMWDCLE